MAPVTANAAQFYMAGVMEMSQEQDIEISYENGILKVSGAEGYTLTFVSLTGNLVMSQKIESPAQKIELNIPKGCYIVKVGRVVRKISIL